MAIVTNVKKRFDKILYYPGNYVETQEAKSTFFIWSVSVVPPVIGLTILTRTLEVLCGRVVMSHYNYISGEALDVSPLNAGIYLLEWGHKGQLYRNKLVIAR